MVENGCLAANKTLKNMDLTVSGDVNILSGFKPTFQDLIS